MSAQESPCKASFVNYPNNSGYFALRRLTPNYPPAALMKSHANEHAFLETIAPQDKNFIDDARTRLFANEVESVTAPDTGS